MTRPPAQTPSQSCLTLGIEVEFYAALKVPSICREYIRESITNLLGDRLQQLRLSGPDGVGSTFEVVDSDSEDGQHESKFVDYSHWNLTTFATAQPRNSFWFSGYGSQPIEIISPPYWASTTHWELDLQRIFCCRVGKFNPITEQKLRLFHELNRTTSIHAHVGNGVGPGSCFPFHTIRNLAMILLVYEPVIDQLLDAELYSFHTLFNYCDNSQEPQSISSTNNPYFQPPNLPAKSDRQVLARHLFNTCTDIRSVIRAMSYSPLDEILAANRLRYYKFNFNPLLDSLDAPLPEPKPKPGAVVDKEASNGHTDATIPASTPKSQPSYPTPKRKSPTVEFRQQIGTMDPDTMIYWVRFLAALVEFSSKLSDQAVIEFLGLEGIDIDYSTSSSGDESLDEERQTPSVTINTPTKSSNSLSALALLTNRQPVGSLCRILTAMDSFMMDLDRENVRYWRRKVWP
ncbi:hypothetical protein MGYG_05489 [Nannizzia gypsea CBS 118893]|uniref:Uncharacterized protein n=1 Tax=Arthroderma gypseum (strain ATCC MYA-4604 / CBS 118893) TaxID=535722 RepID=E4UW48_ARTGP|nr:hypothetical protein MGYG_05489 [Nannizzia gypsea CBS 118893]EFR02496.1 hypothetical protein MGYG_05489 [Nannizzia gypsea CBS 118893]